MNEIRKPSDIISGELEAGKFYRKGRGFVFPGKKHEKIFRDHYYPETLLYARFATIIGLSLYLLNIFNDVTMFPELKSVSLVIRIGCSVGAMAMFSAANVAGYPDCSSRSTTLPVRGDRWAK